MESALIETLRADAVAARLDELGRLAQSRKRKLQELYSVSCHLGRAKPLPSFDAVSKWGTRDGAADEDERRFLEENDLEKSLKFNESSLFSVALRPSQVVSREGSVTSRTSTPSTSRTSSPSKRLRSQTPRAPPSPPSATTTTTAHVVPIAPLEPVSSPSSSKSRADATPPLDSPTAVAATHPPAPTPPGRHVTPTATLEVRTNGYTHESSTLVSAEKQREPTPKESRVIPSTPSPTPLSQPAYLSSPAPEKEEEDRDVAAPVVDIGGVPVVQESSTAIPNEREKAAGVHPPPVPLELDNADTHISDAEQEAPPKPLVWKKRKAAPRKTKAKRQSPRLRDFPESQESLPPAKDSSTSPPSLRTPPTPPKTGPLPQLAPPLAIVTDHSGKSATSAQESSQPEVSSPASSVEGDVSTPGNNISSATSPDPHHILEPSKSEVALVTGEDEETVAKATGMDTIRQNKEDDPKEILVEQGADKGVSTPVESTLPSVELANEIEVEKEVAIPLPTVPSDKLPPDASAKVEGPRKERELPVIAEVEAEVEESEIEATRPSTPKPVEVGSPVSPDPSAQLRLENLLANGVVHALPPVAEEHAVAEQQKPHAPSPKQAPSVQASSPSPTLSSPVKKPFLGDENEAEEEHDEGDEGEDEEDEEFPQPIPGAEPIDVARAPSAAAVPTPKSAPESMLREAADEAAVTVEKLPSPEAELEEIERESEVSSPAKLNPVEETSMGHRPEELKPETTGDAASTPLMRPLPQVESLPDSVMMPVDHDSELEDDEEDTVMDDVALEPTLELVATGTQTEGLASNKSNAEAEDEIEIGKAKNADRAHSIADQPGDIDEQNARGTIECISSLGNLPGEIQARYESMAPGVAVPVSQHKQPTARDFAGSTQSARFTEAEDAELVTPTPLSTRSFSRSKKPAPHAKAQLSKVVISSAHHAAAAAEAEAKRLREDQEQQGLIVVARRRTQQAAAGAARGRPSAFPPGSKLEALARYSVDDDTQKEPKIPDYFDPWCIAKTMPTSVNELLMKSSKTVSTADHNINRQDAIITKVSKRIHELQEQGLWSLQQIQKAPEPPQGLYHWDYLLKEIKWLSTDYREERKWKIAQSQQLAFMCRDFYSCPDEQKNELRVDRKTMGRVPKGIREERKSRTMCESSDHPTPDLVPSGGTPDGEDSEDYFKEGVQGVMKLGDETMMYDHLRDPPPATLFSLKPSETVFFMPPTKAAQELLDQLPLYAPPAPPTQPEYVEEMWTRNPVIPVSKYSQGRMVFVDEDRPLRKRGRYEFDPNLDMYADESDEEGEVVNGGAFDAYGRPRNHDKTSKPIPLHPEQNNVALFRPEFKPTLQRIRNHLFRPPMDQPPSSFFENRAPSLWTPEDDEKLRLLTKEYNYNWQLVSVYMEVEGDFHSGADRRSPWECFERWLSIDNVPQDFTKSPWYKGVQQRLEIAQRASQQQINNAANGAQHVNQLKRRGTLPTKVDRRRNTRTFTQLEAMRKLCKKRETTMNKQAQSNRAAQVAAMRKQAASPNPTQLRTPLYFSTMKYEKELKALEQKQLMAQMGRTPVGGQPSQPGRLPNGVPIPGQAGRGAVPSVPMPSGAALQGSLAVPPAAARSPNMQHPLHPQYASAMRHPAAGMQPNGSRQYTAQELQTMRIHALQRQTQQQQHQLPSQAEMVARVQQLNPMLSAEQAQAQATKQLAHYHAQVSSNMASNMAAQVRRPGVGVVRAGTGGTGVLIGANGPIGPGAAAAVAAAAAQQQSRSATPVGMAQSPRMGQMPPQQQQQGQQQQLVGNGLQSPRLPQQGIGLGVQMPRQQSPTQQ